MTKLPVVTGKALIAALEDAVATVQIYAEEMSV